MTAIPDETLDAYKCILMYDDERVSDALAELRNSNGQDWWHLIVSLENGGYAVMRFNDLEKPLEERGAAMLDTPLGALVGTLLKEVECVEQHAVTMSQAQEQAFRSPAKALVILNEGEFRGILPQGLRRGLFDSSLVEMAGKLAPLPEKGMISTRRLNKTGKKS